MLSENQLHITPISNFSGIFNSAFVSPEKSPHLLPALAVKLIICKMKMSRIIQCFAGGNTQFDFLTVRIFLFGIVKIIGRNQTQAIFFCQSGQNRSDLSFFRQSVILYFQKIMIFSESFDVKFYNSADLPFISCQDSLRQLTAYAGRQRNDSLMVLLQELMVCSRLMIVSVRPCLGTNLDQIPISLIVLCQKNQMCQFFLAVRLIQTASPGYIYFTSDDWLDSLRHTLFIQINCSVHGTVICNSQCSLSHFFYMGNQLLDSACSVKEAVFRMNMKMNKRIISPLFFFCHMFSPLSFRIFLILS